MRLRTLKAGERWERPWQRRTSGLAEVKMTGSHLHLLHALDHLLDGVASGKALPKANSARASGKSAPVFFFCSA